MAIVTKTTKKGVDVAIDSLQSSTYPKLIANWDSAAVYTSYPRANKNWRNDPESGDKLLPEVSSSEKEYNEVLMSDKVAVTSFWLSADTKVFSEDTKQIRHNVSLIFQCDLTKIYPGESERLDERFDMEILAILSKDNFYIDSDISMITGVGNVYSDLTLSTDFQRKIRTTDISNQHVVRYDFAVRYKKDCAPAQIASCPGVSISVNGTFSEVVPSGGAYNCVTGGGSFTYDVFFDGVDTGTDVVIDGSNIDINLS